VGNRTGDSHWTKQMRLRRPDDFRRVRSEGRSWAHPLFVIWRAPNSLDHTRVGITASRKVGNAVARNRARRLLREAVRRAYRRISSGWDIVLVARGDLTGSNEREAEVALQSLLTRAGLTSSAASFCEVGV